MINVRRTQRAATAFDTLKTSGCHEYLLVVIGEDQRASKRRSSIKYSYSEERSRVSGTFFTQTRRGREASGWIQSKRHVGGFLPLSIGVGNIMDPPPPPSKQIYLKNLKGASGSLWLIYSDCASRRGYKRRYGKKIRTPLL